MFVKGVVNFPCLDVFGTIESVKAVAELYAPLSGEVCEVNEGLTSSPELVNADPYGEGLLLYKANDKTHLKFIDILLTISYIKLTISTLKSNLIQHYLSNG